MADQNLRLDISEFKIDLHGTEIREAKNIVRRRIEECHRYGIRILKVVYGTPDYFDHSIAKAVHQLVRSNELVAVEMLPGYVFSDAEPARLDPALRIYLRKNPSALPISDDTSFEPFSPKFETDIARRLRCRTPYMPLRQTFSAEWAARAIGCSREQLTIIANTKAVAAMLDASGHFTWDAICAAAKAYTGMSKSHKRASIERKATGHEQPIPEKVSPAPLVIDPLQRLRERFNEAKRLALESKYENAEQALLAVITEHDVSAELVDDATLELGRVYTALNKPDAEGILLRCMDSMTRRLGRGNHLMPVVVALAQYYENSGDYDAYLRLVNNNSDLQADSNPAEYLGSILVHALIEFSAGKYSDSIDTLRYLSHVRGTAALSSSLDAYRYDLLGMNFSATYELFLAELAFRCALRCCDANRNECEDIRPRILMHQGMTHRRAGRYAESLHAYEEAIKILRRHQRTDSILFADIMSSMGVVHRHLGNLHRADKCLTQAADIYENQGRLETPEFAKIANNFGVLRMEQKKYSEAEAFLNQARDLYRLKSSSNMDALVTIELHRGSLYAQKGDFELCQVALEEALQISEASLGPKSVRTAMAREALADCLVRKGDLSRAEGLYCQAVDTCNDVEGSSSKHVQLLRKKLEATKQLGTQKAYTSADADRDNASRPRSNGELDPQTLMAACRQYLKPRGKRQLDLAFSLACLGNLDDSIDEFEDAELDGYIDAAAYRDYAMIMFIHGRIAHAYFCTREALSLDARIHLHPVLHTVLKDFPNCIDRSGMPKKGSVDAFTALRTEFLRSNAGSA